MARLGHLNSLTEHLMPSTDLTVIVAARIMWDCHHHSDDQFSTAAINV